MLESVFFINVKPSVLAIRSVRGFPSFLSDMWHATSIEFIDLPVKFGKQECGSLQHITLNLR